MLKPKNLIPLFLLVFVLLCRWFQPLADAYSLYLYPALSWFLSLISSAIPFTLEEIIVLSFAAVFIINIIKICRKKITLTQFFGKEARLVLWFVAWFYIGWGITYFRSPILKRAGVEQASYNDSIFHQFLNDYTENLNNSYTLSHSLGKELSYSMELLLSSEEEPLSTETEPLSTEIEPLSTGIEPLSTEKEPLSTGIEPLSTGIEPLSTGIEPLSTGIEPLSTGIEPLSTGIEPLSTGTEPLSTEKGKTAPGEFLLSSSEKELLDGAKEYYRTVPERFGLASPHKWHKSKYPILNRLYSGVGVLGFMGPFMAESQLNRDLLPEQFPFTQAHEYAHLLGVSSEAEANYWAFQACSSSSDHQVRYSAYFSLLSYVWNNCRRLLSEEDFLVWKSTIRPEIIEDIQREQQFWEDKRWALLDKTQEFFYNLYLKGNGISSGTKNYSEVVGLLLSIPEL